MQPRPQPRAAGRPRPVPILVDDLMHLSRKLMSTVMNLIMFPFLPSFSVSHLLTPSQPASPMMATLCPSSARSSAAIRPMCKPWVLAAWIYKMVAPSPLIIQDMTLIPT